MTDWNIDISMDDRNDSQQRINEEKQLSLVPGGKGFFCIFASSMIIVHCASESLILLGYGMV